MEPEPTREHIQIDYGMYDTFHGGLTDVYEKIEEHCMKKYGYGKYFIDDYDVDITINARVLVDGE